MPGNNKIFIKQIVLISFAFALITGCVNRKEKSLINVLILSGRNNHEWQKTTPLLVKMYKDSKLFKVNVTEKPDTLTYKDLRKIDVVVSNWNSWPDNDFRMTQEWEHDFMRYVKRGGGVVFIHAGASSFYHWKEYHLIGIGRWGKETKHGEQTRGMVCGFDQKHPITKGIKDFYVVDEIWENTDIHPKAKTIASVSATDEKDGHLIYGPVIFENHFGKGRSFFTILGHNERALLNTGLQTLILRATEWSAHREVNSEPPADLKTVTSGGNNFRWEQSDTTLSLFDNSEIIWQYNFKNRFGKPYFHPVTVKNSTLTCVSPPDHPWHLGLWFSWKFINGVNYWEYLDDFRSEKTGYRSAGITEIKRNEMVRNADFSADINMELQYHPEDSGAVMIEKRTIHISPPFSDGSFFMDNEYIFNPLTDEVVLDRTPIEGEPESMSWGGYGGLNIRFSQDYTLPVIIAPTDSRNFKKNSWLYMGFNTLTGEKAGICILQNPEFTTPTTSWYVIKEAATPFYYYSPAALFDGKITLKKGKPLHLKYRVWILAGDIGKEALKAKYEGYTNNLF